MFWRIDLHCSCLGWLLHPIHRAWPWSSSVRALLGLVAEKYTGLSRFFVARQSLVCLLERGSKFIRTWVKKYFSKHYLNRLLTCTNKPCHQQDRDYCFPGSSRHYYNFILLNTTFENLFLIRSRFEYLSLRVNSRMMKRYSWRPLTIFKKVLH